MGHALRWFVMTAAAAAAACTVGSPPAVTSSTAPPGSTPTVTLQDDSFTPAQLTVEPGTTVVWRFEDGSRAHNIIAEGFASETKADGTFEHTFHEPGTYGYSCTIHAGMDGTVIVREP
ncbi:MAG: cupredoxin domain-containing protein [Actinobacteria bacterium]|nr:cupredoxin domain-containing protein [Actinomycetota bacterium]